MSSSSKFHLIKSFFVIDKSQYENYIYGVRNNILDLVHYGFSREELYFMPLDELMDYIEIINDRRERDAASLPSSQEEEQIAMMANTVPLAF